MKKKTKELALAAIVTGVIGALFGQKIMDKAKNIKLLSSKVAGDDDMGDEDPIVRAAKDV